MPTENLTYRDVKNIATIAVGGSLIAGLMALLGVVTEKKYGVELKIATTNLHVHDKYLLRRLADLQKEIFQKYPIDFSQIVSYCDQVISLKLLVMDQKNNIHVLQKSQKTAKYSLDQARTGLRVMLTHIKEDYHVQTYVKCEAIINDIILQLEQHFSTVIALTS
jgi:hypothetical protein